VAVPGLLPGEIVWPVPMVWPARVPFQLDPVMGPLVKVTPGERLVEEL